MKIKRFSILCGWFFLLSFLVGQLSLYSHQHKVLYSINQASDQSTHKETKKIVVEKCAYCQAMHFQNGFLIEYFQFKALEIPGEDYFFSNLTYPSISCIFHAGRSPPLA